MQVVVDRRRRLVATFVHYIDAVLFIEVNKQHDYERIDEPGLNVATLIYLNSPPVGDDAPQKEIT